MPTTNSVPLTITDLVKINARMLSKQPASGDSSPKLDIKQGKYNWTLTLVTYGYT
jgi:hypothetical protein